MSSTYDTQNFYGGANVQMRRYTGVSDVNTTQSKFDNDRLYSGDNTNSFMTEKSEMSNCRNRGNTV